MDHQTSNTCARLEHGRNAIIPLLGLLSSRLFLNACEHGGKPKTSENIRTKHGARHSRCKTHAWEATRSSTKAERRTRITAWSSASSFEILPSSSLPAHLLAISSHVISPSWCSAGGQAFVQKAAAAKCLDGFPRTDITCFT